jgi:hypothetical protein
MKRLKGCEKNGIQKANDENPHSEVSTLAAGRPLCSCPLNVYQRPTHRAWLEHLSCYRNSALAKGSLCWRRNMNKEEALSFCGPWLAAWTGNQPEELLRFYSTQAYYRDPARPSGLKGKDEISFYFIKLLAKNPEWVWKPIEVFPTDQGFILKWQAVIPNRDRILELEGMDIVEVESGKITRNEVFFDASPLK